jgi:VanZ family protein
MMHKIRNKIIPWLPAVIWMILIFCLSAQPADDSNGLSKGLTKIIVEVIGRIFPIDVQSSTLNTIVSQFNHYVRKAAHFTSYLILGIFVLYGFIKSGIKLNRAFLYSLLLCTAYAASDEFHQLFVPGRGCRVTDVLIDGTGAFCGAALCRIMYKIKA